MSARDFNLLVAVCFIWGANIAVTRWTVTDGGLPPLFFTAVRFLGICLVLLPFLRPIPKNLGTLFLISLGMGSLHFGLLLTGLSLAEASAVSIVSQLGVPLSTLLSIVFLNEHVGWRRWIGIILTFLGVSIIAIDPKSFSISFGLIYVALGAFTASGASILMKSMPPISALQMQAWIGLFSFLPLFVLSAFVETNTLSALTNGGFLVWAAIVFAVLAVSVFGHGSFYYLLKKYDVSLVSPLTLMTPVWGVLLGVVLLGEHLSLQLILGAIISLVGVFVILVRPNRTMPEAAFGDKVRGRIE